MNRKYIVITVLLLIAAVILKFTAEYWTSLIPKCYFLSLTGFYCPGCGGTRAVLMLLKGNIVKAFMYNPGVVVLAVVICAGLFEKIFNKKILPRQLAFWVVLIVILFAYYILRNFT